MFIIGLVVSLFAICLIAVIISANRMLFLSPLIAAILMVIYAYLYGQVASSVLDVAGGLERARTVLFWFAVASVAMIIAPNHTRTTKKGRADKRFKQEYDSGKVGVTAFSVVMGLSVIGMLFLLKKFGIWQ